MPSPALLPSVSVMGHCRRRGSQLLLGQQYHLQVYEQGGVAQVRTRYCFPGAWASSSQRSVLKREPASFPGASWDLQRRERERGAESLVSWCPAALYWALGTLVLGVGSLKTT